MLSIFKFLAACSPFPLHLSTFYAQSIAGDYRKTNRPVLDVLVLFIAGLKQGLLILPLQLSRFIRNDHSDANQPLDESEIETVAAYLAAADCNVFWDELKNPEHTPTIQKWQKHVKERSYLYDAFLDAVKANGVIIFQGYLGDEAILRHLALKKGLSILSIERTLRKDRLLWESRSGITTNPEQGQCFFKNIERKLTQRASDEAVEDYLARIKEMKMAEHASPSHQLDWKTKEERQARILFLGQVYTDSSLLYGLEGFNNPTEVIAALLEWANNRSASVILKLHPKESSGCNPVSHKPYNSITERTLRQRYKTLLNSNDIDLRIDAKNEYDTYELIHQSDLVLTINSQAGLEAAIMGKPVLHGNRCFYGGMNFTYTYKDASEIHSTFDQALNEGAIDPLRARRFFHAFYDHYCKPKSASSVAELAKTAQLEPDKQQ